MSLSKILTAAVFALSTFGIATAVHSDERTTCIDGSVATGDCIVDIPGEADGRGDGDDD